MNDQENNKLIGVREAAKALGVSPTTIYRLVERKGPNSIPAYRIGVSIKFDIQEILTWAKENR
jgi:excisionase family DNA binding protein